MAAILNATSPLFGALVAAIWLRDRLTLKKVVGIGVAIGGVAVLVGWSPLVWDLATVLSVVAMLAASLCYAVAGAYAKVALKGAPALGPAVGSQVGASLVLAPAVPFALSSFQPTAAALSCVVALAVFSTAVAYIFYFRLIADVGPAKALTVTFLVPVFGVLWGAAFLGESVTGVKVLACAIILAGTSLVTGFAWTDASRLLKRLPRRIR
jgi:drug/metabolite transporter (DMT)-like permease